MKPIKSDYIIEIYVNSKMTDGDNTICRWRIGSFVKETKDGCQTRQTWKRVAHGQCITLEQAIVDAKKKYDEIINE